MMKNRPPFFPNEVHSPSGEGTHTLYEAEYRKMESKN